MERRIGSFTICVPGSEFKMLNWLRPLFLMFYSPIRGMSETRDRAPLIPALILAFVSQAGYFTEWLFRAASFPGRNILLVFGVARTSFSSVLFVALVFVPLTILVANLFDRHGSFSVVVQQEYPVVASAVLYAWTAAHILAIPLAYFANLDGMVAAWVAQAFETAKQFESYVTLSPEQLAELNSPHFHARNFFWLIMLPFFWLWTMAGVKRVFRLAWSRTIAVMVVSSIVIYFAALILVPVFSWLFASPLLLLLLFFFLRGHLSGVMTSHRARVSFKQNLEASTLNPADASAHYNLGLIHQQRNELDEARQRFERAVEIDNDELDSHYQLGRIARQQNCFTNAIKHFEPVVANDPAHAQHEVWREIGATYLAAGQYEDALNAFERFVEHRESDPEGLFLMGRAHAELGHAREATRSMQACITAVETSPAYKYRTDKRWLNQAQEFIRSGQ
jgi:tetratricopeptide (TPR) repeat protein